ncbi:MAG TPA: DegT/DnrJ/EryC1/StrS aminotransferase [Anaerolineaceae bacterium]|jgi:dTDP-4-amino-4,6-dideoxygalactose transaminase|nr:DegT/DnrJ/EryC1/StrS aminotransferase [Anaerolineaceae bacterium]
MNWIIPLADLNYDQNEENAVVSVLRSKWLTMGSVTAQFEQDFAAMTGSPHCLSVSNATEALHLACVALGIGPGDEVIVPSLTFVATANAVLYTGAKVVFADVVSPNDLTISPASIESCITPHTKAIIVMHYAGYPCDMPAIMEIAQRHNLSVIEDAAHCPGATLDGKALGTWGEIGCFSFFSNKNLATGEGGMLTTNSDEIAAKLKLLRSHGMTTLTYDRHAGHAYSYDVVELGYNYRIDEIRAALGIEQLKKLPANNQRRREIVATYREKMPAELGIPFAGHPGVSACHISPVLLPEGSHRKAFQDYMKEHGIQTSIHYPPIHTFSYYREHFPGPHHLPITESIAPREVTLPLYPTMTDEQIDYLVKQVPLALKAAKNSS